MNNSGLGGEVVVDANVLIHSRGQFSFQKVLMPSSVQQEVISEMGKLKMEKLDVSVMEPSNPSLERVKEKSDDINSPTSSQDEEALALALDKQLTLVTDDKALQNLSLHFEHDFEGFNTEGIDEKRVWKRVCGNCGVDVSSLPCPRCGSQSSQRKRD